MKTKTMRRVLGTATAVGASVALVGSGLAGAAPSSELSSDSGGSSGSGGLSASVASADANGPLTFSFWDNCDTAATTAWGGPAGTIAFGTCIEDVVRSGTMQIGGFTVPIPDGSLRISGGAKPVLNEQGFPTTDAEFIPAPGTKYGVFYRSLPVPGGAIGTSSAENFGLTSVQATVDPVGMPDVTPDGNSLLSLSIDLPVRIKLSNPLLGDNCYLGSEDDPITLRIRTTDTSQQEWTSVADKYPDAPAGIPGGYIGNTIGGDNQFAVPGATGCGLFGSLNGLVNARAQAPSPSGNNSLTVSHDVYTAAPKDVAAWKGTTLEP
ncbi:hypothetical protein [Tomitella gaofuii]|uniref:hypothetical protein n=1 Tax=Tomitella gaofuii TaxID=2760083 RepID=UPI0015FB7DB6|nr:hypothetical protein [Tomitella gaofuii]